MAKKYGDAQAAQALVSADGVCVILCCSSHHLTGQSALACVPHMPLVFLYMHVLRTAACLPSCDVRMQLAVTPQLHPQLQARFRDKVVAALKSPASKDWQGIKQVAGAANGTKALGIAANDADVTPASTTLVNLYPPPALRPEQCCSLLACALPASPGVTSAPAATEDQPTLPSPYLMCHCTAGQDGAVLVHTTPAWPQ